MLITVHTHDVIHYISDDSHDDVAAKEGGGFAVSLSCPAWLIDDRRFTLETLSAGLVSCSSHDDTDASHTTTVLWILLVKFHIEFITYKYLR